MKPALRRAATALRRRPQAGSPEGQEGVEEETSIRKGKKRGPLPRWLGGSRPASSQRVKTLLEPAHEDPKLLAETFVDPAAPTGLTAEMETPSTRTPTIPEQRAQEAVAHLSEPLGDSGGVSPLQIHRQEGTSRDLAVQTHPEPRTMPSALTSFTGAHGFTAQVVDLTMTAGNTTRVVERNNAFQFYFSPQFVFGQNLAGQGKHGHPIGPGGGAGPYVSFDRELKWTEA